MNVADKLGTRYRSMSMRIRTMPIDACEASWRELADDIVRHKDVGQRSALLAEMASELLDRRYRP